VCHIPTGAQENGREKKEKQTEMETETENEKEPLLDKYVSVLVPIPFLLNCPSGGNIYTTVSSRHSKSTTLPEVSPSDTPVS
jgi:hypothetical protein